MNKNIIIIAIIAVLIVLVGLFAFMQPHSQDGKLTTEINFLNEATLKNGEAVLFELKGSDGKTLEGQNVTITFVENGENQVYSIVTDSQGKGSLVINNEASGSYDVTVSYQGNIRYNGCTGKQTITVEDGIQQASSESTDSGTGSSSEPVSSNSTAGTALYNGNSSSSEGPLYHDNQYNFNYDENGIIRGGQNDGYSADYIRSTYESGNMVDEEGNLQ